MDTSKFYFGELRFGERQMALEEFGEDYTEPSRSNNDFLAEYIQSKEPVYTEGDAEWRFGRCQINKRKEYIVGKFGKVFDDEPTKYDDDIGDFVQLKGEDADVSFFVLFLNNETIAFSRKLRIGPEQFATAFAKGFNNSQRGADELEIQVLEWKETLDEILESADRVFSLDFDLETTNPGPTEDMEAMDNQFREARADDFEIELNTETALNVSAGVVRAAVAFVRNSYGHARAKFERDGRKEEYSTKSDKVSKELPEPEELDDLVRYKDEFEDQINALEERQD